MNLTKYIFFVVQASGDSSTFLAQGKRRFFILLFTFIFVLQQVSAPAENFQLRQIRENSKFNGNFKEISHFKVEALPLFLILNTSDDVFTLPSALKLSKLIHLFFLLFYSIKLIGSILPLSVQL